MWLGLSPTDSTYWNEDYLKFNVSTLTGQTIDSANLVVYPYHQYTHATPNTTWMRRVSMPTTTPTWVESTLKWSNRPGTTTTSGDSTSCVEDTDCTFTAKTIVQGWASGTFRNDGFWLGETDTAGVRKSSTSWKRLIASEEGSSTRPRLVVTSHLPVATTTTPTGWRNSRVLAWSYIDAGSLPQSDYEFDVSTSSTFTTLVYDGAAVAGAATTASIPGTVALANGTTYYWRVRVRNGTSWSAWAQNSFQWDLGLPTGSISVNAGAPYATSAAVTLTLTATDGNSGVTSMRFSNDGTTWSAFEAYAATKAWTLAGADGTKTVSVQFQDAALNQSAIYADGIILDTADPTGSIAIANGAPYAQSTGVTLNVTYADTGSGPYQMRFSDDGTTWSAYEAVNPTKAWTLTAGDGTKTTSFQVKDNSGRTSAIYSDTIVLDATNPTATITINGGAASTASTAVTLSVTSGDAGSGVASTQASNDDVTYMAVSGPSPAWTLASGSGTRTVYYRVTDGAGRTVTVSDTISLTTGPVADFVKPDEGATVLQSAPTYPVTWQESGTGIVSRSLQRESGPVVTAGTCSGVAWDPSGLPITTVSPVDSSGLQDGFCYRWKQTLTDNASQSSTQTSGAVLVDSTLPVTSFTSPAGLIRQVALQATVSWTEADAGGGISARILQRQYMDAPGDGGCLGFDWFDDGNALTTATSPHAATGLVDGFCYRWVLTVIDQVGNTTYATSASILVDTAAPAADFVTPNEGATMVSGSSTASLSWTEQGGASAIASRSLQRQKATVSGTSCGSTWTADGSAGSGGSSQTVLGLSTDTCYRWLLTVTDGVGNTATQTSGTVRVANAVVNSPIAGGTMFSVESLTATTTLGSVTLVEFVVDGAVVASDASSPYAATYNTAGLADGTHSIAVKVTQTGGVTTTSPSSPINVSNASSSKVRLDADYAAGASTVDTWVLNGVYAALAPNALPSRYRSTVPSGTGDDMLLTDYLSHWPELQQATRDQITSFLGQPFRGDQFQPTSNLGAPAPGITGCGLTRTTPAANGYPSFTVNYCQQDSPAAYGSHFQFNWTSGPTTSNTVDSTDVSGGNPGGNGIPDFVDSASVVFEDAYDFYVNTLGFEAPIAPGQKIKVWLSASGGSGNITSYENLIGTIVINVRPDDSRLLPYSIPHELFHVFQYHYKDVVPDGLVAKSERDFAYEGTANWATHRWLTHYRTVVNDPAFGNANTWTGDLGAYVAEPNALLDASASDGAERQYGTEYLFDYIDHLDLSKKAIVHLWESLRAGQTGKQAVATAVAVTSAHAFPTEWVTYAATAYEMTLADPDIAAYKVALEDHSAQRPDRHPLQTDPLYTGPDAYGDDRPHRVLANPAAGSEVGSQMDIGELGMGFVDIDPGLNGGSATISVEVQRPDDNVAGRLVSYQFIDPADHKLGKTRCGPPAELLFTGDRASVALNLAGTCETATLVLARTGPVGLNPFSHAVKWTIANGRGIISNGTVQLGVNPTGNLIVPGGTASTGTLDRSVGLRLLATGYDGLSPECDCEGWGVSDGVTSGWASVKLGGAHNLAVVSFTQTAQTARSEVLAGADFRVVHQFDPVVGAPNVYRITVSITKLSAGSATVQYRRTMDWDVEPTAFTEYVTIGSFGAPLPELVQTTNNGFVAPDPLVPWSDLGATGMFQDFGPKDQGALFHFNLGSLDQNGTKTFSLFYGAAPNETQAVAALQAIGARVYSLGEPSSPGGATLGQPTTFFFGYAP